MTRKTTHLRVSEMFGPTLQGEGRWQGRPVGFVRLGLCNLDCRWCDTPFTWDWRGKNGIVFDPNEEMHRLTIADVVEWCEPLARIVVSGGEPLVQKSGLIALTDALVAEHHVVAVETNGTIAPDGIDEHVEFTVSPKIGNSGVAWNLAIKPDVLAAYNDRNADYKFVISEPMDVRSVIDLQEQIGIPKSRIWLMPEGRSKQEIVDRLPWLFELACKTGFNLSSRLHVLAYDDRRGV